MYVSSVLTSSTSALSSNPETALPPAAPFTPITIPFIKTQIALIHDFFLAKLHANNDQPLVEDEDLPQKQKLPKPRLPPTGKITSPRKRPNKEPGPGKGHPKKKMKLNDGEAKETVPEGASKEGDGKKPVDVKKESEKAEKDKGPSTDKAAGSAKPLTNGVGPSSSTSTPPQPQNATHKAPETGATKAKEKLVNGESAGMISPESLEAS